nr:aldose epimerase family protein [Parvularcula maris]
MPDGREVLLWRLEAGPCSVEVLSYGGAVRSFIVPGRNGASSILLGFDTLEEYVADTEYIGVLVGRYANRIAGGRFTLGGETYELSRNENGNTLHGGEDGFSERLWEGEVTGEAQLALRLVSQDGDQGFPGRLETETVLTLTAQDGVAQLTFETTARTSGPTVFSPTFHGYFNLGAEETVADHRLQVAADRYTPADDDGIPTGTIEEVGGPTDLRRPVPLSQVIGAGGLDHNFVLRGGRDEPAARLTCEASGRRLDVVTDRPGLQVYTGDGLSGPRFAPHAGAALETQAFPNSPNEPGFPSTALLPGETFRSRTVYRVSWQR